MTCPEVLLLPVLMLADYYLTILGAVLRDKKYSEYVAVEQYELNPIFQKAINKRKLINFKHLLCTTIVTGGMIYITETPCTPDGFVSFILGSLLIIFSVIIGRHITNILIFLYFIRRPCNIKGKIEYTYEATLFLGMYLNFIPLIALIIICIYERSFFVLGGVFGMGLLILTHFRFLKKMRQQKAKELESLKNNIQPDTID